MEVEHPKGSYWHGHVRKSRRKITGIIEKY